MKEHILLGEWELGYALDRYLNQRYRDIEYKCSFVDYKLKGKTGTYPVWFVVSFKYEKKMSKEFLEERAKSIQETFGLRDKYKLNIYDDEGKYWYSRVRKKDIINMYVLTKIAGVFEERYSSLDTQWDLNISG